MAWAGCGQQGAEAPVAPVAGGITLTDGAGRVVILPAAPHRIVSLSAAATDILVSVGAQTAVVGATRYCVIPAAEESHVTRIGGMADPDYERILALKPDLVVAPWLADKTLQDKIAALGLPLVVMHPEGLQGVLDDIQIIGQATGHEAGGEAVAKGIENIRALVAGRWYDVPAQKRPRVLVRMDEVSQAPGSYVDDLITAAGGRNVLPRGTKAWVEVSPESVLQLDPDLIIVIESAEAAAANPVAVKADAIGRARVVTVPDGEVFYHPGPGVGRALWELARAIYPAKFSEATPPGGRGQ